MAYGEDYVLVNAHWDDYNSTGKYVKMSDYEDNDGMEDNMNEFVLPLQTDKQMPLEAKHNPVLTVRYVLPYQERVYML